MALNLKFKPPTIGHYALAGSLCLHAGVLALSAGWQWEMAVPRTDEIKTVKVKFIEETPSPPPPPLEKEPSPAQEEPSQPAPIPAARARTLASVIPASFLPRTPEMNNPSAQPVQAFENRIQRVHTVSPRQSPEVRADADKSMTGSAHVRKNLPNHPATPEGIKVRSASRNTVVTTSYGRPAVPVRTLPAVAEASESPRPLNATGSFALAGNSPAGSARIAWTSMSGIQDAHPLPLPSPQDGPAGKGPAETGRQARIMDAPVVVAIPLPANRESSLEGIGEDLGALREVFTGQVRQRISRFQVYPRIARRRGMEGQPVVAFTLNQQGQLTGLQLDRSSGYDLLDQAALDAVKQGAPYPAIPPSLQLNIFQFKLPISFILK